MQRDNRKPIYKTVFFWQVLIASIVVLTLIIGLVVAILNSTGLQINKHKGTYVDTTTAPSTEATLPPPPANPYNPLDFYYENGYLTCGAGESSLGIDVSYWQGNIDWQQVKDAGVEFAMIRVGYRGSDEGTLDVDSYAQTNYDGASAAGIKVGAYIFSQAVTPEEAVEEAEFLLEHTQDWKIDIPLVFDWEVVSNEARNSRVDSETLTACVIAFCERIKAAGHEPMIYFSKSHSHERINLSELVDYKFWLAMYDPVMDYPYRVDMWQYTDAGTVPGIAGNVDINLMLTYPEDQAAQAPAE